MQIKEVTKQTGLTARTIRFYEAQGLIAPSSESRNGRTFRDYDARDVAALESIAALRRAMFTVDEIRRMQTDPAGIGGILKDYTHRMAKLAEEAAVLAAAARKLDGAQLEDYAALATALEEAAREDASPRREIAPHFGRFDPEKRSVEEERRRKKEKQQKLQNQNAAIMMQTMANTNQRGMAADRSEMCGSSLPGPQRFSVIRGLMDEFSKEK